jgi:hypothetical protein
MSSFLFLMEKFDLEMQRALALKGGSYQQELTLIHNKMLTDIIVYSAHLEERLRCLEAAQSKTPSP